MIQKINQIFRRKIKKRENVLVFFSLFCEAKLHFPFFDFFIYKINYSQLQLIRYYTNVGK